MFQINTRVWLTELSRRLNRAATFDDIPDVELDRLAYLGFDWVWLLSVWQTGTAGQYVSRHAAESHKEFEHTLSDLQDADISGSGFAITRYTTHQLLGGDAALARLRERLRKRDIRLMLDFVPNHTALDHPWVQSHPDYYVAGTEAQLEAEPQNYIHVHLPNSDLVLAYGRDPYFAGWPDTLQLDYSNPAMQDAMIEELLRIAGQCDGVRCDMAMLILPDIFERTWKRLPHMFWPRAITLVREQFPPFCFMAEVYWDLEWTLQQQGFDYTYDKRLYDRLRANQARPVREHLNARLDYQDRLVRFLENHDEPRAAAVFTREVEEAAAIITYLSPGLRLFYQGQFEGRKLRISPHLVRAPLEPTDEALQDFHDRLLSVLRLPAFHDGCWQQLECVPAWEGNETWDGFLAFLWQSGTERYLVAVNYAAVQGQCYVRLPFADWSDEFVQFHDLVGIASYDRDGNDVIAKGLYLDLPPWGYHVFVTRVSKRFADRDAQLTRIPGTEQPVHIKF